MVIRVNFINQGLNRYVPSFRRAAGGFDLPKKPRGISHSVRPVSKRPPIWCRYQPEEVEALVVKLTKEGYNPSQIGTVLRDQYGIPLVKYITGRSITKIQKDADVAQPIPPDFESLLRKAARIHAYLEKNPKDLHNRRALQLIEARIRKLAKYYIRKGVLPKDWKYSSKTIAFL